VCVCWNSVRKVIILQVNEPKNYLVDVIVGWADLVVPDMTIC